MEDSLRFAGIASLSLPFCLAALIGCSSTSPSDQGPARSSDEVAAVTEAASSVMALQGAVLAGAAAPPLVELSRLQGEGGTIPWAAVAFGRAWGADMKGSCVKVTSSTDRDGDGIPADGSASFSCSSSGTRGEQIALSGVIVVRDSNDDDPAGGYAITYQNVVMTVTEASGAGTRRTLDGSMASSVDRLSTGPVVSVSLEHDITFRLEHLRGELVLVSVTSGGKGKGSFVLDAPPQNSAGTLTAIDRISLVSVGSGSDSAHAWELRTDPSLHWSLPCTAMPGGNGYDSGAAMIVDDAGSTLRVEYLGCGEVKTLVDGKPL